MSGNSEFIYVKW